MEHLIEILTKFKTGEIDLNQTIELLRNAMYKDIFFAKIDISRKFRTGLPEVILAEGKTPNQIREIVLNYLKSEKNILITRASKEVFEAIKDIPNTNYYEKAKIITIKNKEEPKKGIVAIVTGGTADINVAEEAAVTAEFFGINVKRIYDVGVAGLHRLINNIDSLLKADVVIVCAGMDGALFSVVGGLVGAPVIAVPTSVGYGSNFKGLAPLLNALNSCTPNVSVVNIDNGFGAAYIASLIIKKIYTL